MNHVDPELLAAWTDGTLPSEEARAVESHLADCAECRAVAAAFSQAMESDAAESRDDRRIFLAARGTADVPSHSREEHTALAAARAKWILPLAATILIGSAIAWKFWPHDQVAPPQIAATAPPQPIAPPPVAPPAADVPMVESRFANPPVKAERPKTSKPAKSRGIPATTTEGASAPPTRSVAIAPPPPPPMVLTPPAVAPPAAAPAPPAPVVADLRTMAEQVKVTSAAGGGGRGGRGGALRTVAITSTAPVRWRVTSSNAVERSMDDGVTWTAVAVEGMAAQLTAGAAPNPETCWLVGRMGAVFISKNGGAFKRVPFPEVVDLVSIVAISDLRATVITADGRAFVTEDGGETWRARF